MSTVTLAGTGTLTRLALRRDRLMIPLWALVTGGMVASGASSLEGLYDTAAARAEVAASMTANSSMRALYGPVFDDSVGGLVAWRFGTFAAVLAAVASLIVVVRHTREEEETGRQEMLSAGAVGRRAPSPPPSSRRSPSTPPSPSSSRRASPARARPGRSPSAWPSAAPAWSSRRRPRSPPS